MLLVQSFPVRLCARCAGQFHLGGGGAAAPLKGSLSIPEGCSILVENQAVDTTENTKQQLWGKNNCV